MDYKIELIYAKSIVFSKIYRGFSHPSQAIRMAFKSLKKNYQYLSVFIMNSYGEMWYYGAEKKNGKYSILPLGHELSGKREVNMVFSGNVSIAELM